MAKVIAVGECMIELSGDPLGAFRLGYAGDTFNTSIYMARLGLDVRYATALGDDRFSDAAVALMQSEGIDTALVQRVVGQLPGLYLIDTDAAGERRFSYWRDTAAIRALFAQGVPPWRDALLHCDAIYISGITLAVIGTIGQKILGEWLVSARQAGAKVAFDVNFRPQLWSDHTTARAAYSAVLEHCDFVSVSNDDVDALWPGEAVVAAWTNRGIETILRSSSLRVAVSSEAANIEVIGAPVTAVDTTGAGDSFNAAYLAARLTGDSPACAAEAGHRLAAAVVQTSGAILPREAMPAFSLQAKPA